METLSKLNFDPNLHREKYVVAAYIVLAAKLGAALVTRDGRLASASGHAAAIELF